MDVSDEAKQKLANEIMKSDSELRTLFWEDSIAQDVSDNVKRLEHALKHPQSANIEEIMRVNTYVGDSGRLEFKT